MMMKIIGLHYINLWRPNGHAPAHTHPHMHSCRAFMLANIYGKIIKQQKKNSSFWVENLLFLNRITFQYRSNEMVMLWVVAWTRISWCMTEKLAYTFLCGDIGEPYCLHYFHTCEMWTSYICFPTAQTHNFIYLPYFLWINDEKLLLVKWTICQEITHFHG